MGPQHTYAGSKGFDLLSNGRLGDLLDRYQQMRDHGPTPPAQRRVAREMVRQIHDEFGRRAEKRAGKAVAA